MEDFAELALHEMPIAADEPVGDNLDEFAAKWARMGEDTHADRQWGSCRALVGLR